MTTITTINAAQLVSMLAAGTLPAEAARLSAERPMLEVHKASGQAYARTLRAYEATRHMAASLGPKVAAKLDREYTVYKLEG